MSINSKSALRKKMKLAISKLSPSVREEKDKRISHWLRLFIADYQRKSLPTQNQSILNLGVYSPLKDEVSWQRTIAGLSSIELSYPSFESEGVMVFRQAFLEVELEVTSSFGVPIGAPANTSPVKIPDICLIPGLSFSKEGERLGRGKGYYDRYLESFSGVKIGIAYSEQMQAVLPREEHDELLDGVVTDQGFYYNGKLLNL